MSQFDDDLEALGFRGAPSRRSSRHGSQWTRQATRYLTFSVLADGDDTVIVTWELAIGDLMGNRGLMVGTSDPLQVFAYPNADARGPAEASFVTTEMKRVLAALSAIDLGNE